MFCVSHRPFSHQARSLPTSICSPVLSTSHSASTIASRAVKLTIANMSFAMTSMAQTTPVARAFAPSSLSRARATPIGRSRAPLSVRASGDPAAPDKTEVKDEVIDCKCTSPLLLAVSMHRSHRFACFPTCITRSVAQQTSWLCLAPRCMSSNVRTRPSTI